MMTIGYIDCIIPDIIGGEQNLPSVHWMFSYERHFLISQAPGFVQHIAWYQHHSHIVQQAAKTDFIQLLMAHTYMMAKGDGEDCYIQTVFRCVFINVPQTGQQQHGVLVIHYAVDAGSNSVFCCWNIDAFTQLDALHHGLDQFARVAVSFHGRLQGFDKRT